LSSAAYEQVRDKLQEDFVDLGEQSLKNIARPMRAYAWKLKSAAAIPAAAVSKPRRKRPLRLWFAVAFLLALGGSAWLIWRTLAPTQMPRPQIVLAAKFEFTGKVVQADDVGAHGEGFTAIYESSGRSLGEGPDHTWHCLGLMRGAAGEIAGESEYCVETDPDGDQVLWKVTTAPHALSATKDVKGVFETILGTGKYTGVSASMTLTCQPSYTGLTGWTVQCDAGR
jgi:hypothetical protein